MLFRHLSILIPAASGWVLDHSKVPGEFPESPSVIDALQDTRVYERLVGLNNPKQNEQSLLQSLFDEQYEPQSSTCGASAACPAYDGQSRQINGRKYHLYCTNAPWGTYFWLPKSKSLSECEQRCHDNSYDCNGLTFYPSTGACSIIYSKDAAPYIWDNGYQKIGAIPADSEVAFGPGMICPLPGSDNQVYDFDEEKNARFKMSCRNQFRVSNGARRQVGTVRNVDECGLKCGKEENCHGFQYYQPTFPGGRADGARNCELIMEEIPDGNWVPLHKPNQYLSGLRVKHADCGDIGWNQDEKGDKKSEV